MVIVEGVLPPYLLAFASLYVPDVSARYHHIVTARVSIEPLPRKVPNMQRIGVSIARIRSLI